MDYNLIQLHNWLDHNLTLVNASSPASLRTLTQHVLMGRNYRLITEKNTKDKLLFTYLWLSDIVETAKNEFGENWRSELVQELLDMRRKTPEQKNLLAWLLGLTHKTSVNLGVTSAEIPSVMSDLVEHVAELFAKIARPDDVDKAWLLLMAGSATLTIRGSDKSTVGKQLEKVLIRAALAILGFEEGKNFWMNIERDNEVDREADAEIESKRGRIRVEVGLIASGNQEVVEDKINRVGRNGIILFDIVGSRSRIHETADRHAVKLIQIRNNQPLVEIHRHLTPLVQIKMSNPPTNEQQIQKKLDALPDKMFHIPGFVNVDDPA